MALKIDTHTIPTLLYLSCGFCIVVVLCLLKSYGPQSLNQYMVAVKPRISFEGHVITFNNKKQLEQRKPFFKKMHKFDCEKILNGDHGEISKARKSKLKFRLEADIYRSKNFCNVIRDNYYFPTRSSNSSYSLAYVILLNEHTDIALKLLQAIYSADNFYCFHVDLRAKQVVYQNVQKIVSCFENIIMTRSVSHIKASWLALKPVLNCFESLLKFSTRWKHVVILEGHDFPLHTTTELSYILKTYYNESNDIGLGKFELYRLQSPQFRLDNDGIETNISLSKGHGYVRIPNGIQFYKSMVQSCLLRSFAKFSLGNNKSIASIRNLHKKMRYPHESYFSTLVHNSKYDAPGYFPPKCMGQKEYMSRFTYWHRSNCETKSRHDICIVGLDVLANVSRLHHFFINKFYPTIEPIALECQHELIFNRTYLTPTLTNQTEIDNMYAFYGTLAVPRYEVWKRNNRNQNSTNFKC